MPTLQAHVLLAVLRPHVKDGRKLLAHMQRHAQECVQLPGTSTGEAILVDNDTLE